MLRKVIFVDTFSPGWLVEFAKALAKLILVFLLKFPTVELNALKFRYTLLLFPREISEFVA